jgi:hypothetical protein
MIGKGSFLASSSISLRIKSAFVKRDHGGLSLLK